MLHRLTTSSVATATTLIPTCTSTLVFITPLRPSSRPYISREVSITYSDRSNSNGYTCLPLTWFPIRPFTSPVSHVGVVTSSIDAPIDATAPPKLPPAKRASRKKVTSSLTLPTTATNVIGEEKKTRKPRQKKAIKSTTVVDTTNSSADVNTSLSSSPPTKPKRTSKTSTPTNNTQTISSSDNKTDEPGIPIHLERL
jgi:hypothetical protein